MVIGSYDSNNWGFHDVSGNALEWCMVSKLRGGSWRSSKYGIRLACRNHPDNFTATIGFRVSLQKAPDAGDLSFLKIEDWIIPSVGLEMIWCKPGTFLMGSPKDEPQREDNEFQQKISINLGFFLGKYEITQQEYETVMHTNPSKFKNKRLPVETVSLNDALNFCEKLTELERKRGNLTPGWVYKLPTEVQWEYACRAGTNTRWSYGDSISLKDANFAGDKKNDLKKTSEVGKYKPNPWGFYDMHGNVEEWCRGHQDSKMELLVVVHFAVHGTVLGLRLGNKLTHSKSTTLWVSGLATKNNFEEINLSFKTNDHQISPHISCLFLRVLFPNLYWWSFSPTVLLIGSFRVLRISIFQSNFLSFCS